MKNPVTSAIKKMKGALGGSSSRRSHCSDGDSQGRRMGASAHFSWEDSPNNEQDQEEQTTPTEDQCHGARMVPPMRALNPKSGLLFNQQEYQKYLSTQEHTYEYTKVIDPALLSCSGMNMEFTTVFSIIGWKSFWQIDELGIKLLTIEFLCSLQVTHDGVYFRMFNQEHNLTWKQLNVALGNDHCSPKWSFSLFTHRLNAKRWYTVSV